MTGGLTRRVLVVDDDRDIRELVRLACRAEGFEVRTASNGQDALETSRSWRADVVFLT